MARYFNSQIVKPISTFVPENLDFYQGKLEGMQKKQDAYRANIASLNSDILSRQEDKQLAFNDAKKLNERIGSLANYDINNPNEHSKVVKELKDINFQLGNYGVKNAYESRLKQEQGIVKNIEDNKDYTGEHSWIKDYQLKSLKNKNSSEANPVNYNPNNGTFNQIKAPDEIPVVDVDKKTKDWLDGIEKDSRYYNGASNLKIPLVEAFREGKVSEFGKQKVFNTLAEQANANPEVLKYYQAKSNNFGYNTDESKFINYDKDGNAIGFNTNTLLGSKLQGRLTGKVNREEDISTKTEEQSLALYKAKHKIDNPDAISGGVEVGNPENNSLNSIIKSFGMEGLIDENGDIVSSGKGNLNKITFIDPKTRKQETITYSNAKSALDGEFSMKQKGFTVLNRDENKKSFEQNLDSFYKKAIPLAHSLGIEAKNGDYKTAIYNYMVGVSKNASMTATLNPSIQDAITENHFSNNSDISNMEIYPQGDFEGNTKATKEVTDKLAGNTKVVGVDYYSPHQTGWKISVTPKEDGKNAGVDKPYIAIPKDENFKNETKPVWQVSRGAYEYAKSGKIDPKYNIGTDQYYGRIPIGKFAEEIGSNMTKEGSGVPVSSSFEPLENGLVKVRVVTHSTIDNVPVNVTRTFVYNQDCSVVEHSGNEPLSQVQDEKTTELYKTGKSLSKYTTEIKSKVKNSDIK